MLIFYGLVAGAFGALVHDIFDDNSIQLPRFSDHSIVLGFLGGAIVGAFVGLIADHDFLNAAIAGYAGNSLIQHLAHNVLPEHVD